MVSVMLRNTFFAQNEGEDVSDILLTESNDPAATPYGEMELPVDLFRSGNYLIARAPIIGADLNNISVKVSSEVVTIYKNSWKDPLDDKDHYYLQECYFGALSRTLNLPKPINPDKTRATLTDGVLNIIMPLTHQAETKVIRIQQ